MIKNFWNRYRRAKIRSAIRGYRRLKASNRLVTIEDVCAKLLRAPLSAGSPAFSNRVFGAAIPSAELAVRQYLYVRLALYKLPQELLRLAGSPNSSLHYPLPRAWQDILNSSGFPVNRFSSSIFWRLWLMMHWGYGAISTLRLIAVTAISGLTRRHDRALPFAHFEYIGTEQTPRPGPDGRSHDIMSWYMQWKGRNPSVQALSYRVKSTRGQNRDAIVTALVTPVLPTLDTRGWLRFVGWALRQAPLTLFGIFSTRWWHALLLSEAALAALTRDVPAEALARDYLMNISGWLYRPLWTYEAEQRGSRILLCHYSTNSSKFKLASGYAPEHHTWKETNWPLHLVWDENQAEFVQRAVKDPRTEIAGPIWFSSSPEPLPEISRPAIAVFDVQPFRLARYAMLADDFNYYTVETCTAFLRDVAQACSSAGFQMVWKRKRQIGKIAHPQYRKLAEDLEQTQNVLIVPAEHSAIRVIEGCNAVISLPFTSTALLGDYIARPTCYYDPSGMLQKDDRSAHGIHFVQGYDGLLAWIQALTDVNPDLETNKKGLC